jgi:hypothetical protein
MILYGTGLGPVAAVDDAQIPTPGALPGTMPEVLVGGKAATVTYAGRSGCCPGLDQIILIVPDDIAGCYTSVLVIVGATLSNAATISVAPTQGTACSDDHGRTANQLRSAQPAGEFAEGTIVLHRLSAVKNVGLFNLPVYAETAGARFDRYTFLELLRFHRLQRPRANGHTWACVTHAWGQFTHMRAWRQNPSMSFDLRQ